MKYRFVSAVYHFLCFIVRLALLPVYSIRFEGRENIPDVDSAIFASNHRSYLDPVLTALTKPHPVCFVAKESLFKTPGFSHLIRALGAFPSTWSADPNYNMAEEASKRLKNKRYMTIFPEGTRHTDGKVGKGKTGVCVLATKSGVPVVPVGIIFNSNNLHFRSKICVRIGKPFYPEEYGLTADSNPLEMKKMKDDIMSSIKTMVEENPPFEIIHDEPKHKSSREKAREEKNRSSKEN